MSLTLTHTQIGQAVACQGDRIRAATGYDTRLTTWLVRTPVFQQFSCTISEASAERFIRRELQ